MEKNRAVTQTEDEDPDGLLGPGRDSIQRRCESDRIYGLFVAETE